MSLRESIDPWVLRACPPGTRRFAAAQFASDVVGRRAPLRDLLTDTSFGGTDAQFRRWLADRPLPDAAGGPGVIEVAEPWTVPDSPADSMVVFTRDGDRFREGALALISEAAEDPDLGLVYWDDALIETDGRLGSPRFRPSWSPELLLAAPYLHRSFAIRRDRLGSSGEDLDSASVWGLLFSCGFAAEEVKRLPFVLGEVEDRADSPDVDVANAGLKAAGLPATMGASGAITWSPTRWPPVTIVIPTRHNREHLETLLPALGQTTHPDFDVLIVDNGLRTADNEAWYQSQDVGFDLTVEWWDQPFNYSAVNNRGADLARGDVLVFLNDDAVPLHPTWLENLVGWLEIREVGIVGAFLVSSSGRLEHAGIVVGMHSLAGHLLRGCPPNEPTMFGPASWPRDVMAVTGACLAVRRETFDEISKFDERFELTGSDVALGVAAVEAGYRNVCVPWSRLLHDERSTRGSTDPPGDVALLIEVLADWLQSGDPWYSPNLSLRNTKPELRSRGEIPPIHG